MTQSNLDAPRNNARGLHAGLWTVTLCALVGLPSCIGATVFSPNKVRMANPTLGPSGLGTVLSNPNGPTVPAADWKLAWGPPTETRRMSEREERWTYLSDGRLWRGALIYVLILPVPVCIPVGHERVTLTVRDGNVVQAEIAKYDEYTFTYGVTFGGSCGGLGFGAEAADWHLTDDQARDVGSNWRKPKSASD